MKFFKTKILYILLILLLIIQAGLIFVLNRTVPAGEIKVAPIEVDYPKVNSEDISRATELPTHYSFNMAQDFFEEAYGAKPENSIEEGEMIYGGIIPHHLLVKNYIAAYFESLKNNKYKKVILIGPNHFGSGSSDIIVSTGKWQTPYGILEPDIKLISKLRDDGLVSIEEEPFVAEHSISGLVSFIKKSLGDVKFTPIILKSEASEEDVVRVSRAIADSVDMDETLVLASVDFSHYQPFLVAEFHDGISNALVNDFDFERVKSSEVDSPVSLFTLLKYLDLVNAKKSELVYHTNSGILTGQMDEPTTTHNFFVFKKGESVISDTASFLFFGDFMVDRYVADIVSRKGLDYLLDDLAGGEKRFFSGIDVISANLEGAVTNDGAHYDPVKTHDFAFSPDVIGVLRKYSFNFFNLANNHFYDQGQIGLDETRKNLDILGFSYSGNHLREINEDSYKIIQVGGKKIAMVGLNTSAGMYDEVEMNNLLSELEIKCDLTIINIHWGTEYLENQNKRQADTAHKLIDAGADLVIGHHPHVVEGIEIYKNVPIFYSLGNFIFDQYFSPQTQEGLAVGIIFSKKRNEIYLFPINSEQSKVSLLKDKAKNDFLERLTALSEVDENTKEAIKAGYLQF